MRLSLLAALVAALIIVPVALADSGTNTIAPGVQFTSGADPDRFLPPAEAAQAKAAPGYAGPQNCWNLQINNEAPYGWLWDPYRYYTQLHWCGYAWVTSVYRSRGIYQAGAWQFLAWTQWQPGGCVGCWQVNVRNSSQWKRTRPFNRDIFCHPTAYLEGRAGGSYYWSRSENCD